MAKGQANAHHYRFTTKNEILVFSLRKVLLAPLPPHHLNPATCHFLSQAMLNPADSLTQRKPEFLTLFVPS